MGDSGGSGGKSYSLTINTGGTPLLKNTLLLLAGAAAGSVAAAALRRVRRRGVVGGGAADGNRSTTSSAGGGAAAYETRKAVDEYLQFHFGKAKDVLPYEFGPKEALRFTEQLALLCERHCAALRDFTGENPEPIALDVGCAVGGASFGLARSFSHVMGLDFSMQFVNAAQTMRERGWMRYSAQEEADISVVRSAVAPEDVDRSRLSFRQGDACNLPLDLGPFDAVLAANLLCRLPDPQAFLQRLPSLVKPGGVLVLASPYSWLEAWTHQSKWLGGYQDKAGNPVSSADSLKQLLADDFDLVEEQDLPFLIREHSRKFQWGVSHALVWVRRQ